MAFAEHHDMIEAFPADRADQTFDKPCQFQRRRRSGNDRQDVEALSASILGAESIEILFREPVAMTLFACCPPPIYGRELGLS
jgi:hypothetical protein